MTKPFTYLIGWKALDKWYYGVRYARGCHPDDLWTKYFTSSKYVLKLREDFSEPDVIEIRQTFDDSLQAREWEEKVLRRLNVIKDGRWLNKNNVISIEPQYGNQNGKLGRGILRSVKQRQNISNGLIGNSNGSGNKGKQRTEEQKDKMRKPRSEIGKTNMRGIAKSEEHKEKLALKWDEERRSSQSQKFKGVSNPMSGKTGSKSPMFNRVTVYDCCLGKTSAVSRNDYLGDKDRYIAVTSKRYKEIKS